MRSHCIPSLHSYYIWEFIYIILKETVAEEVALYTYCEELLKDKYVDEYYD